MRIVVTGVKGSLSSLVAERLNDNEVFRISLRGEISSDSIPDDIDCVVHIAGVTPANAKGEDDYETVNVTKTEKLYRACQAKGVKHFIYISSMSVYEGYFGRKRNKAIGADTPCSPISAYAISKHKAEKTVINLCDGRMKYSILRVPSLYDDEKKEYFNGYFGIINKLPFVPRIPVEVKRSLLHTGNLCSLIKELSENPSLDNRVLLPQDEIIPDVNTIMSKIAIDKKLNKRVSFLGGLLIYAASFLIKKFAGMLNAVYYLPEESILLSEFSINDITL